MFILVTLFSGFAKALRYWQIILLLVILQVLGGWLLAMPLTSQMHETWDHSLVGDQLNGEPGFGEIIWDELSIRFNDSLGNIYSAGFLLAAAVFFILANTFVLAGALTLYSGPDLKFNWERFWSDGSRFFRPFLGLALVAMILFFAVDLISLIINDLLLDTVKTNNEEVTVLFTGKVLPLVVRYFLFSLVVLIFMYAKLISAADQIRNIIYLMRRAFTFVVRHFVRVIVLFLMLNMVNLSIAAIDVAVWHYALDDASIIIRWIWFLFTTFLLVFVKLSFFSSQMVNYVETGRRESTTGKMRLSASYSDLDY